MVGNIESYQRFRVCARIHTALLYPYVIIPIHYQLITKASGVGGRVSKLRDIILGRRVNTGVEGAGHLRLHALSLDIYQHVVK